MSVKKTKIIIALLVVLSYCVLYGEITSFDVSKPDGGDDPKAGDDEIRAFKDAVQERMNDHIVLGEPIADEGDHYWPKTGSTVDDNDTGQHRMLTLRQMEGNPSALTSYGSITDLGFLYLKESSSGNSELYWQDEAGRIIRLTNEGDLYSSTNATIAGTLDVVGLLTTGSTILGDGSQVAAATEGGDADRTISDKAYVDNQIAANALAKNKQVRCWVQHGGNGQRRGTGLNITSTARNDVGDYTVTWATNFADDNYAVSIVCKERDSTHGAYASIFSWSAGSIRYRTRDTGNTNRDVDCFVTAFGDLVGD